MRACVCHWLANFIDYQMELLKTEESGETMELTRAAEDGVSAGRRLAERLRFVVGGQKGGTCSFAF